MDKEAFYLQCLEVFHETAALRGCARHGMVIAPDLQPFGERAVTAYYGNPLLAAELAADPTQYYYTVNFFCLQCGILFADLFRTAPLSLTDGYVGTVTAMDPWPLAKRPVKERLGMDLDQLNRLAAAVFNSWIDLVAPHDGAQDAADYIYYATLAMYQLGISMTAGKEKAG